MRSWHDYHLTGYAVDGPRARIVFNVSWPYDTATEVKAAQIIFTGVAGYFFEHDLGSNILYSVSECPVSEFVTEHAQQFEQQRKWGWPLFWKATIEETLRHLNETGVGCFEVSSSYGMSGWVLAAGVDSQAIQI